MTSKYRRKGQSKHIRIDGYVKRSDAWKSLSPVERCAYLEMKWRYNGYNNGFIGLGCRELAAEIGMGRTTASQALEGLLAKGFVAKAKPSAFSVKNRAATEWRLTEYKDDATGELASKDFMRWRPEKKQQSVPPVTQSAPADTPTRKSPENGGHSPLHRTVKPNSAVSQSAPADTYISTMGGRFDG